MDTAGKYEGEIANGRYNGKGKYQLGETYYEGNFLNGYYHGEGVLYVKGGYYKGYWQEGKLVEGGFIFDDGLPHLKVGFKFWDYCSQFDHRFHSEIKDGIKVGERLRDITSHEYVQDLPKDCFDTIDGYYDPKKHLVFSYTTHEPIRTPNSEEIEFILKNCRVGGGHKMSGMH